MLRKIERDIEESERERGGGFFADPLIMNSGVRVDSGRAAGASVNN